MTWTYTGDPNVSDRDKIRFLIGDTDTNDQLVNDEEIQWALDEAGSIYQAAHDLCTVIASKFARMATSKSVGDLSLSYANRAETYHTLANRMLHLAERRDVPTPWASPYNMVTSSERTELGMQGHEFWTGVHDNQRL